MLSPGKHASSLNFLDSLPSLNEVIKELNNEELYNEPDLIGHSPYLDDHDFISQSRFLSDKFTILSLNCQSLNAKIDDIKAKLYYFGQHDIHFSVICHQETWLDENSDTCSLELDYYTLISQSKSCSAHGGLLIYIKTSYKHTTLSFHKPSNIWEGQFIEIVINEVTNNKLILGNIYRPPKDLNQNYHTFINEFSETLDYLHTKKSKIIIAGDYNIDLLRLKEKPMFSEYYTPK